jgi:hypothetical protein
MVDVVKMPLAAAEQAAEHAKTDFADPLAGSGGLPTQPCGDGDQKRRAGGLWFSIGVAICCWCDRS